MISVAMATYNSERYIIQQLDSIVNQTQKVDEVIIQDDCSQDETVDIIKQYIKDKNLKNWKVERNEHNMGYVLTFKNAIQRCNGEIIILCDHDDVWMKNKVELISKTFAENLNILVLATSFTEIDDEGKDIYIKKRRGSSNNNLIRRKINYGKLNHMFFKDVAIYNISPGCTCAFKKEIKKELLKKNYDIPHDWQIELIGVLRNGLYYLDVVTTKYRIHSKNTIGLGHQTEYDKRLKLCINGLKEKEEIKSLINTNKYVKSDYIKYINKVIKVFKLRVKLMQTKNIIKYGTKALVYSIGMGRLYESVGIDIISIIKDNKRGKNK